MPFLRFTRDARGYESTFLIHDARRRGKVRQTVLYWFRSPPDVKVGRAALDEEAIRWIEEHNPDIAFDWPKILDAKAPLSAPASGVESRRVRRARPERPRRLPKAIDAEPPRQAEAERATEIRTEAAEVPSAVYAAAPGDAREPEAPVPSSGVLLEAEQRVRLQARCAELLARITERGGSPERVEALRARAQALNPDTWVTEDDIRKGLAGFDAELRDLRAALGLPRRRRSRRGGRRHRRGAASAPPPGTGAAEETTPDGAAPEGTGDFRDESSDAAGHEGGE